MGNTIHKDRKHALCRHVLSTTASTCGDTSSPLEIEPVTQAHVACYVYTQAENMEVASDKDSTEKLTEYFEMCTATGWFTERPPRKNSSGVSMEIKVQRAKY